MPAAWKNSAISRASGAPPETAKRSRPPRAACIFEKTSLSASLYCTRAPPGTGSIGLLEPRTSLPTDTAQSKIFRFDRRAALGAAPGTSRRPSRTRAARSR